MLAEALRLIRVYHDMKQQELANQLGLSKSYVSEIESGKKVPSMEVVQKYSDAFWIPLSSIFFFAENIETPENAKKVKAAIAEKILQFLQFIEAKTTNGQA